MLVAGADRTVNPDFERWYAKRAMSHTVEIKRASHSVYISHPNEVGDVIESAARAVSKYLGLRKKFSHREGPSHCPRQKYPAIKGFYALVYRNDKVNGSSNEKDRLSRAIHAASIAAGCARAAQAAGLPTVEQALASLGSVERELICLIPS